MSQTEFSSLPRNAKIYVAGHRGLVGSAIVRELQRQGFTNIICRSHNQLDLTQQQQVNEFFAQEKPDYVILAAAKVGGIHANNVYRGDFIYQNLMIATNVIHASYVNNVKRLVFLGSSCIYPKNCRQPIKEEYLLTSELEQTNQPYALAKISGIEMCWSYNRQYGTKYVALMPTNLYGIGDNYHPTNSHVIPGLIRRAHQAKENQDPTLTIWGTGQVWREFLLSDDLARACIHVLSLEEKEYDQLLTEERPPILNVGSGSEVTIRTLAETICRVVGYQGQLVFDTSKPDGTYRKYLDTSKIMSLGWQPSLNLEEGLVVAYQDFQRLYEAEQQESCIAQSTSTIHISANVDQELPIVNLVLSGGVGSRLWPVSNPQLPKQFSEAVSNPTLYHLTIQRLQQLSSNFVVVANNQHLGFATKALENLQDIANFDFVLESIGRNTAPAVLTGLLEITHKYGDALVLVSPADHLIKDFDSFVERFNASKDYVANNNVICTFGIEPDSPRTEYGYIAPKSIIAGTPLLTVEKFHEKPEQQLAQEYLQAGYLWNSGIYFARASNFLASFKQHQPEMYEQAVRIYAQASINGINIATNQYNSNLKHRVINLPNEYQTLNSISIDYAISEVAQNMITCRLKIKWTDMGSWESILANSTSDLQQNVILGTVYSYDLHNSYIKTATRPILAVGVKDLVVIDTDNFTLISAKDQIKFAKDKFSDFIKSQES